MSHAVQSTLETTDKNLLELFRARVAEDLMLLAKLHDSEPDKALIEELNKLEFPQSLTLLPETGPANEAMLLMKQTLLEIKTSEQQSVMDDLAADYAAIYLTHSFSASPEESVWLDEDSLMCQDSMFQVRSWFETYGLGIENWRVRPDDHLVYQLQFIATLLILDNESESIEKAAAFMDEHLLRWLGNFAERVLERCDTTYFASIAAITATYCEELRDTLAKMINKPRPTREEIDIRMRPNQGQQEVEVSFMPGMGPVV